MTEAGWKSMNTSIATSQIYPHNVTNFSLLDDEPVISKDDDVYRRSEHNKIDWIDFIDLVIDAGRRQAVAYDMELPEYFSSIEKLSDKIINSVNESLSQFDRYSEFTVAESMGNLVIHREVSNYKTKTAPSAGHWNLVSHLATIIAGDVMPSPPPLIGDNLFGRCKPEIQSHLFQHIKSSNRQAILLLGEIEIERIETAPDLRLTEIKT
jgi:hypothetical protein